MSVAAGRPVSGAVTRSGSGRAPRAGASGGRVAPPSPEADRAPRGGPRQAKGRATEGRRTDGRQRPVRQATGGAKGGDRTQDGRGRGRRQEQKPGRRREHGAVQVVRPFVPVLAGIAWTAALVAAAATASAVVALLVIPVAVIATASGLRAAQPPGSRRARRSALASAAPVIAGVTVAAVAPLAAVAGPAAGVAVLLVLGAVAAAVAASPALATSVRPVGAAVRSAVAAVAPAAAATSLVIARHQGTTLALALIGAVAAYDAAAFVMGHGRTPLGGPVAVASGVVAVAVVAVFVAAVMDPPFSGHRPWVVMGAVAVLAPLGVLLGTAAAGRGRLPALRRLDSLFLVGPVWALFVSFYLHR